MFVPFLIDLDLHDSHKKMFIFLKIVELKVPSKAQHLTTEGSNQELYFSK